MRPLLLACLLFCLPAWAQVYKWTDSTGKTVYGDKPPEESEGSKGIAFTDIDVEKSEDGRRRYKELGGGGVPIILVGSRMMQGFSEGAFEDLGK